MDTVDLNETGIREKLKHEVERFKKMQQYVLGGMDRVKVGDIDTRTYAKCLLREGSDLEKRELLGCIKSKLFLKEKRIELESVESA